MKKLISSIFVLILCAFMSNAAIAQERVVVPLSNPGKPGKLSLDVIRGSITVNSYKGKNVIIHYNGGQSNDEPKKVTKDGLHRISSGNGGFQVVEDHNHVTISGTSPMHQADFRISVPQDFSLDLSTIMGDIKVNGVAGEFNLHAVNGDITLTSTGGAAAVNTVNGDITAIFTSVSSGKPMSFSTINGDIDVTFPADAQVSPKMKAQFGEVYTDFDMDIKQNKSKDIDTGNSGLYKVSVNDWIYGNINGGGPEYTLKTLRGDIYIRKTSK